jgi:GrpB-like predicted nucleotidyltransferase (UPF0157 family)
MVRERSRLGRRVWPAELLARRSSRFASLTAHLLHVGQKEGAVPEPSEILVLAGDPSSEARRCFVEIAAAISARLPRAEVEHVGSTAVPGCLTKGDVDVLVRASSADFLQSLTDLDGLLTRSTRNEPTDDYVEYDYSRRGVSASVQLVVAGGWHDDHFHGLKAILKSDPEALERYNEMKLRYDGHGVSEYREAKARLIESLLVAATAGAGECDRPLRPGVYE